MTGPSIRLRTGEGSRSSQRRLLSLFLGGALSLTKMALPEIVWVLGRTSVVPKGVPSPRLLLSGGGAWGGRKRPSLWMRLTPPPSPSPHAGERGFPSSPPLTKGRESVVPLTKGRNLKGAHTKA